MFFSSPSSCQCSLTCSMLFFYNMIYATCFIFFLCKFSNDLHFSYLKFFIALVSWFLPLCARQNALSFLCLSFSKHSASEIFLSSIGFLFVHLIFIWFFFNSSNFSFPYILYSSCILFSKFCKCSSQFVFVYDFPLLIFFVYNIISYKIFSSFLFFYISIPIPNGWCLWTIFQENLSLISTWRSCIHSTFFFHSTILSNILSKKLLDHILYLIPHLLLCRLHPLLVVMLICCGPRMDLTFILNCRIFLILFKVMLKQIMLKMLQMLNLLMVQMLQMLKLLMLLLFYFRNSITLQFVWISRTLMSKILILLMIMFLPTLLFVIYLLVIPRMMFLHLFMILSFILIFNFQIIMLLLKYIKDLAF